MKPKSIPVKHCRVCKSDNIRDLEITREYYLANLDQTIPMTYSICLECNFIFQGVYVGDDFLNYHYRHSWMLRTQDLTIFEIDQNERQGEFLSRHVALQGKRVLEIGAGAGAFLRHLHVKFDCTAYFEELSEEANKVMALQDGLNDFRNLADGTKVDLVVLRHVLEHIHDLDSFLNYLHSVMEADGVLFIEVPDWTHLDKYIDPLIFEHLSQFNSAGLVQLLRSTGWQVEALEKSIHPDDPATPNRVMRIIARQTTLPNLSDEAIVDTFRRFSNDHHNSWKTALNSLLKEYQDKTVALYPASHLTFVAIKETELLGADVLGMFDLDEKKQGLEILGLKVFPPDALKEKKPDLILIFTMAFEPEIRQSFKDLGLTCQVVSISELVNKEWVEARLVD